MMGNELAKTDMFKSILNERTTVALFKNSLKDRAGAFMASMIDLYSGDSYLQQCDPRAVVMECVKAATLDLPINKSLGFAYVVPFKGKPQFQIGYKGLIQLAMRTGSYRVINSGVVYEGEFKGIDKLSGTVDISGERTSDTVVGYFAYFRLLNGAEKTVYMSKKEAEDWGKKYSQSYSSQYSPWKTDFDKMAQKTCLKRLIGTYGMMSLDMQNVINDDAVVEANTVTVQKPEQPSVIVDADTGEIVEDLP